MTVAMQSTDQSVALLLTTTTINELFEPLIGKKSIQYANGPEGRKRRQLMDRSFSHEAVKDYYEHFVKVHGFISMHDKCRL